MNIQQAKKIAASPIMANVTYNGTQIYIQHVDESNEPQESFRLTNRNMKKVFHCIN